MNMSGRVAEEMATPTKVILLPPLLPRLGRKHAAFHGCSYHIPDGGRPVCLSVVTGCHSELSVVL
jgi:hypothetical protein